MAKKDKEVFRYRAELELAKEQLDQYKAKLQNRRFSSQLFDPSVLNFESVGPRVGDQASNNTTQPAQAHMYASVSGVPANFDEYIPDRVQ